MPSPQPGTYFIVHDATERYLEIPVSVTTPGTALVGGNEEEGPNQRWLFEREGEIFMLTNLMDPIHATVRSRDHIPGSNLVLGDREQFIISQVSIGRYRLVTQDQNLVWVLPDGKPGTHVQLQPRGGENDIWRFRGLWRGPDEEEETDSLSSKQ